jgi:repressor LexA
VKRLLTARQAHVLASISQYIASHGWPPTRIELANALGITPTGAHEHLRAIAKKGHITIAAGVCRGIRLMA